MVVSSGDALGAWALLGVFDLSEFLQKSEPLDQREKARDPCMHDI